MMATVINSNQPDVSLTDSAASTQQAVTSNDTDNVNNVDSSNATVNGSVSDIENKQIADIVDELVNSAEASVSGGSDTEASKADPSKRSDGKGHVRASSTVRKPQSFKSVSVNRTFLAAKASATSTSRPESAAGSASSTPQPTPSTSASRLKLVAKSGSSLGGSTKTLSTNGKASTAPDPNTVWNRNRPAPPPEQKKLSDDELVHKYGIHLADRLGPGDTKGHANWADIDDDDEEWAPETITWTDGTKITLPHADEGAPSPRPTVATLQKEPAPVTTPSPAPPKSKSPAPTTSATGSPSVKPGVLASGKGLVLKGAPEKPTLVAKPPPPPTPVKSPWATLPPVEKVPPVPMDLPSQPATSRHPARDSAITKSVTPPPTKEIAADDFSRTGFREGHVNNQLFNSHSGRYEPVPDRRGSRNEVHGRQPALLQRPSYHEQQGPAEPSAAFQTSRTTAQEGPYGRRRGSSNVSGGSGSLAHRLGKPHDMPPPPEVFETRAGSITGGVESPISTRTFSPANNQPTPRLQPSHLYQPRASPGQVHATPIHNMPAVDGPPQEDDFEVQKKVMRERREQAIKRRVEEEAREEEARKARIAEKLKAMGPPPERKSKKEEKKDDSAAPAPYTRRSSISTIFAAKPGPETERAVEPKPSVTITTTAAETDSATAYQANGDIKQQHGRVERPQDATSMATTVPKTQPAPHWPEATQRAERFTSWGSGSQHPSRNVWGAPGNDRSLGNGTFNADLGSLPDSHPAPMADRSHRPAPIGPPSSAPQKHPELPPNNRIAPIGPPRGRPSHLSQPPRQAPSNPWQTFNAREDDRRRALERREDDKARGDVQPVVVNDTWRAVDLNESGKRTAAGTSFVTHGDSGETPVNGSWKPTAMNKASMDRPEGNLPEPRGHISTDYQVSISASHPSFGRQAPVGQTGTPHGPTTQPRSGSRFFPSPRDTPQQEAAVQEQARTKSPTPPPPTADGHPVFDGDVTRPHVALPPARPRVKLPPSNNTSTSVPISQPPKGAPISFAAAAAAPARSPSQSGVPRPSSRGKGYQGIPQRPHEIASQENWQDRINNLMGKKSTSPAKSMAVDSSSRIALEDAQSYDPATVALPGLSMSISSVSTEDTDFTSREMAEECFGEQEMGSLPAVRLPSKAPDALWQAVLPNFDPAPAKWRIDPTGAEAFRFLPDMSNGRNVIRVSAPGMSEAKTVPVHFSNHRSGSNPRRAGPRGNSRRASGRGGHRGGREPSDHPAEHTSASRPPSTRGRGYRPRTENWVRNTASASAAQS
ncbi:hypothetical protein F4779DRAFT_548539 [Xylariaceae sp. FL0662B]|nr:hypothetical protein F4779DRAFT_548539 [Xylariaceae sp. FL0662B]